MSDLSADKAAIIQLLHANRIAMWTRDFEAWSNCFVHAPYTCRWGWWPTGGVFVRRGYDDLAARWKRDFGERPTPMPAMAYDTQIENLSIQLHGDMAWATFEQRYPEGEQSWYLGGLGLVHEFRVLERHQDAWKIAFLGFLDGGVSSGRELSLELDATGRLLRGSAAAEAILASDDNLVIRNSRLRLRDARADQKLQAAIRWAASLDSSYMSQRGAVPVVIEAGENLQAIVYWVVADAGGIFLSFADRGISEQRLELATMIYGLAPAQKRLAGLVAEGKALSQIAAEMGITTNTARTHLNRVFEKTGVRNQTALVRVLLSAVAPI